jgi:hypothetical protein
MGPLSKGGALLQEMKTAAAQGALYGAGNSDADLTKGEIGKLAADTATGAAFGAVVPPALEGAKGAIKAGAKAVGYTGKKMFSSLFGVTEENASKYLARREEINAAPELTQIKTQVDDAVLQLAKDVDSGKVKLDQAQDAIKELKTQVRNQLTDAKVDAREALRRSEDMFKEAAAKVVQPLKDTRAPTDLANEVVNAVGDLKRGIVDKSGAAWETLEKSNQTLPTKVLKGELSKAIDSLRVGGKDGGAIGQASESAISSLQKLRGQLDTLPEQLSMSQVKQIVQNLDRDINWRGGAGEFMDAASQEKLGVRRGADAYLKRNVPEYAQAMGPVADDARLLDEVASGFGDERRAIGRLGQIASPKGDLDRQALQKLEQATGREGAFTKPIDEYTRAQALLKDPAKLEEMRRALPEYGAYRQAMAKLARMKPDWTRDQLERALANSKEARALATAEETLSKAESRFEPVSSLTPASTESKLKSFMKPGGAPIETRKALESLEAQSGKKFTQSLDDRSVLDSFSKPYANGARNTVLWSVIGTVFGGLPGAGLGASYGQLVDRYGPKMGKAILDGISTLRENPSIQTVRSLNLPQGVKDELEREFKVFMIMRNAGDGQAPRSVASAQPASDRSPSQDSAPLRGEDRWAANGIDKIRQHDSSGNVGAAEMQQLLATPKGKRLLIEASDLKPGSKAMQKVYDQIQKELRGTR